MSEFNTKIGIINNYLDIVGHGIAEGDFSDAELMGTDEHIKALEEMESKCFAMANAMRNRRLDSVNVKIKGGPTE